MNTQLVARTILNRLYRGGVSADNLIMEMSAHQDVLVDGVAFAPLAVLPREYAILLGACECESLVVAGVFQNAIVSQQKFRDADQRAAEILKKKRFQVYGGDDFEEITNTTWEQVLVACVDAGAAPDREKAGLFLLQYLFADNVAIFPNGLTVDTDWQDI